MTRQIAKRLFLFAAALVVLLAVSMCGDKNQTDDAQAALADEPVLTTEEQRAYRAETAVEADEKINDDNFEKEYLALKKEIEADL